VLYNLYTKTSLPQNLTSDQEKLLNNTSGGKKGRNLQESNRGGSLSRMDRCIVSYIKIKVFSNNCCIEY